MSTWICTCNAPNPGMAFFCHLCGEPQPPTFFYASNNTTTGETMSTSERERLAEEYLNKEWTHFSNCWSCGKQSFLAGYDAATKAKDEETAKLKEDFKQCCEENKSAWDLLDKRDEEIAALKAKDEELENLKKEIHALKIEMFSVAGGREILKAENARLVEIVKQVLHARQCNAPFGQMEKMPTVNQLKEALAARKEEK